MQGLVILVFLIVQVSQVASIDVDGEKQISIEPETTQEIGIPEGFFPDEWMILNSNLKRVSDFEETPLKPLELQPIRWKGTGHPVTYYGYHLGLYAKLREALMDYANRLGITDYAKSLTQGNALKPDSNQTVQVGGLNWFFQRPKSYWTSNMHWLSPADEAAHYDFLDVLSRAGFDEILEVIGNFFRLDGLVCYHATFIAVSHCSKGYVHYDFTRTGGKAFNIVIPLILVDETSPELEIRDGGDFNKAGRYRYVYDVAAILGDDAYHGTAPGDYRLLQKMRLAATIYVADVNEYNAEGILNDFTQAFPPSDDPKFLLDWAGRHWKPSDPSTRLPRK